MTWEQVCAFACTLPGVEMAPYYGAPAPKVNGKAFLSPGREPGSFCLFVSQDEKAMLMETDPETFWQTDHYRDYPAVLVRFDARDRERVELYIRRAWWDRARPAQRSAAGMEERP